MRPKNEVAVVLGASAEGGTGWAIAERFASKGARVIVGGRSREPLEELVRRIDGDVIVCDVAKGDQIAPLAKAAAHRPFNIAINAPARPVLWWIKASMKRDVQRARDVNAWDKPNSSAKRRPRCVTAAP